MLNTLIVGASGYAGAELVSYVNRHPHMTITALTVSAQSNDAGKLISDLHPQLKGIVDLPLQPMSDVRDFSADVDVVFLATAHEVSHDLAPQFLQAGCVVFDLSGAFRVNDRAFYEKYYGFTHQYPELLEQAVYGLAEWNADKLNTANLIAVPGCYPTAAQLSLKPLIDGGLLDLTQWPVINATSGVSGAGRKAAISNSFCESESATVWRVYASSSAGNRRPSGRGGHLHPASGEFSARDSGNHYLPPESGSNPCAGRRRVAKSLWRQTAGAPV